MSKQEGWQRLLREKQAQAVPLKKNDGGKSTTTTLLPNIVNMVTTVRILPEGFRIPLEALALRLGPCSQFAPMQFAANIIRVSNGITDSTTLIFGTGKLVLVSALTMLHTCYMSQYFRLLVEEVECMVMDPVTKRPVKGNMRGKTIFYAKLVHNIVGSGELGCTVNLQKFRDANAGYVKYLADSFPAANTSIWLTPDKRCHCGNVHVKEFSILDDVPPKGGNKKKAKKKCICTIKCLVFESGNIVLIGGRTIEDINSVFVRIGQLIKDFNNEKHVYTSLGQLLAPKQTASTRARVKKIREITQDEAVALAIEWARKFKTKRSMPTTANGSAAGGLTPLMKYADAGRFEQLKKTLAMDSRQLQSLDDQGKNVYQRLLSRDRNFEQERILNFLKQEFESQHSVLLA